MKDLSFLKSNLICRRGLFDNTNIYENTIMAYEEAIKHKLLIEIDIRMLADGSIVCFHDTDMKRMLHVEGNVEKLTYEELSYIAKYDIPLLEDVLTTINGRVPILIQIMNKSKKNILEKKLVELLDNYSGLFVVESFELKPLKWFYKNKKEYITGYMIGWKNFIKDNFFKKYDFYNIKINTYRSDKIKKFKENKMVIGWRIETLKDYNENYVFYDNLICDNALEILEKK